ncbi:hypothetical protein LEP1GSC166_3233 [Leptospira kirschneri]|nr:hypothetical protein LEP1GSC198_3607 [Leptospira kirschneri str. JB]EMK04230.1 hypothetical protein LEP1GSC166_3233 [Leptospira kirschneri]
MFCDKINDTQFYKKSVIFSFLILFHKFEKKTLDLLLF